MGENKIPHEFTEQYKCILCNQLKDEQKCRKTLLIPFNMLTQTYKNTTDTSKHTELA